MARVGQVFSPGTSAPEPGFDRSRGGGQAIAIGKGNILPPVRISGEKWKLIEKRPK